MDFETIKSQVLDAVDDLGKSPEDFNVDWVAEELFAYGRVDTDMLYQLLEEAGN